jgi:apolipoprotein N-acyltransferase
MFAAMDDALSRPPAPSSRAKDFLRLWFVVGFSWSVLTFVFNLIVYHWIDLRPVVLLELLVVPLAQSAAVWAVVRRRRPTSASPRSTP